MFLFVVVSRQTKKAILYDLCVSALIGVNLRLIILSALLSIFNPQSYPLLLTA